MKSKKTRSSSRSKTKSHTKAKAHTKTTAKTTDTSIQPRATPNLTTDSLLKKCQELEVGDIGGFGSTAELEEHEKRCSESATEFCTNCGKSLCHNHYDLLHRDHDHTFGQSTSASLA